MLYLYIMKRFDALPFLFLILVPACNSKSEKANYSGLTLSDRLIDVLGKNGVTEYSHNLILKDFDPDLYSENDLIRFADKYLDTVLTNKPVSSITICKPFKLERHYDSRDIGPIRDHAIISFDYDPYSEESHDLPHIHGITLWLNGKPVNVSPLDRDERMKELKNN